ncbi:hypothetical protein EW145_g3941 [Phellinidium pouzarii]|uniref:Opi1-domain-containing protein n=1 Tax=Phellinidium pouzarii TaxID=167371 RepID=A0A4S4L5I2_9AGAM|nr:hypothetical protein EW145_g3941 [Phellinidium pouzarii]
MSNVESPPSASASSSARPSAKGRLSLSALCNPTSMSPTMPAAAAGPSSSSRSSSDERIHPPQKSLSLDTDDENVLIAVRALDDMRSGAKPSPSYLPPTYRNSTPPDQTPSLTTASTSSTPSSISQSLSMSPEEAAATVDFVSRVSGLPIVNTALRAYEHSKASSRVVKYGAEMMESSVKSISKPVISRLPVNQLDEFACRQLDRFEKYGSSGTSPEIRESGRSLSIERDCHSNVSEQEIARSRQSRTKFSIGDNDENEVQLQGNSVVDVGERTLPAQEVAGRSRWHSLLYEAGGISAAVSEESMRKLKYCLQWLQYATERTDGQILILRNFIASLNAQEEDGGERPISASHMQTLTNVKRDIVGTIRQVVDVVSKYAGGALPEPARARVRQFILHLPQRWANTANRHSHVPAGARTPGIPKNIGRRRWRDGSYTESGPVSAASTAPSSPLESPRHFKSTMLLPLPVVASGGSHRQTTASRPTAGSTAQAAQRLLTLATESLDMMRSVNGVFKESLDRADTWVDRLRVIGIQRQEDPENSLDDLPLLTRRSRHAPSESFSASGSGSGSATASYTSFPSSPRSWPADASSPGSLAANSLDALTLSSLSASPSTYATPRSSTQSLPGLAGYDWEYTARKLQAIRNADERRELGEKKEIIAETDEQSAASALSALRGSTIVSRDASMEVDDND